MKFVKFLKRHKKAFIITGVLLALVLAIVFALRSCQASMPTMATTSEAQVTRQDIRSSITGTATVKPKDEYSITSLVNGAIVSAPFEEGDLVEKGDLLYKIDAGDVEKSISSADVALRRSQLSYEESLKSRDDLYVTADTGGIIKTLHVKEGDAVQSGQTKIADIYDSSYMELVLPFNESDIGSIHIGDSAVIRVSNTSDTLYGTVSRINNASYAKSGNMLVQDVIIQVQNPGVLTPEDVATATIGNITCNDSGKFKYITEKTITAKGNGTVAAVLVREGNRINAGDGILTLTSDTVNSTIDSNALAVEESRISKEKALSQLDDYTITAPISGTVVTKTIKTGDKLDNTTASKEMAVIYDLSSLKFDLNVDELDINKLELGQEVSITADALDGKSYTGSITNISINGTSTNGVTTYPVTVEITDFDDDLLPGMNVDAEIVVGEVKNTLAVPAGAVNRGDIVYVKGDKTEENDSAPEGYKSVAVTTGLYNDDYIEILSGLQEGDAVWVQSTAQTMTGFPGGMGGPGGGGPRP